VPSRREYSRDAAMAKKRDTEEFKRMSRALKTTWDDEQVDAEASTYLLAQHGPQPPPPWLITSDEARQYEVGILKTGKEADVYLVERRFGEHVNVLAAKRYRSCEERLFRDDSRYRGGRHTGESRLDKAIARGNRAGMAFRAQQWMMTEFEMLTRLWSSGVPVPYPVQRLGNEVMLELIGSPEEVAPRLVHAEASRDAVQDLWRQLVEALHRMIRAGVVHGDLSPYNILVDGDRLVLIDFPQSVDPIAHPEGRGLLRRDVDNVCEWFGRHGVVCDSSALYGELLEETRT